ncbi:MAG: iron-containing alcohol dehydrogenase [Terrimonas ferruginea]|uniref:iron-containing alcohol dehydrogenase n=1 Tax=Terrimonas ferruginea TaxID=249 RepID=UPI00092C35E1|nr:iron-containing alcohol dehydrogenase [Terrimonas ferruginea]MBN8781977.1 iron-containing alcohol dehydrogenase [Terrimonas ferruginea]OJW45110.1 MAG: alcohol dehydrogenase [Sphingobacteriales bacterium 48-107]
MQSTLQLFFPGKLIIGNGCLQQLQEEVIDKNYRRVFLMTIEPLKAALTEMLEAWQQKGIGVEIYTAIVQEPSFADFATVMKTATPFDPDVVIGTGGGSVLDVAKLVAAQLHNEQTLSEYVGIGLLKGRKVPLICAPATAGTGSEVSPNAILVDPDNQKKGIISPWLVPDQVYVDPLLTISVPPAITAATGIDALTHCLEAYTNKFAQPFIDMFAAEGMRRISANIVKAVQQGNDVYAREQVAMGSLLGGFCLGPVNTAGVHALSYPLGSKFHLPHGLSNALLLPYVMEYNIPAAVDRYADVAIALGCERQSSAEQTAKAGVTRIRELIRDCGLPATLADVNVPEEAIPAMAAEAITIQRLLKNNPRTIGEADAIAIYKAAFHA